MVAIVPGSVPEEKRGVSEKYYPVLGIDIRSRARF
jgi:hypothetical protein